jgi:hypothetical protein
MTAAAMAAAMPYIVAGAAVVGVAGAGYSAYSSYQQGKTANAMAQYNAHQQEFNAKMQLMGMQAQAAMQKRQAEANFGFRRGEAQAKFSNAVAIENTVEARSRSARESIRRKATEYEGLQAAQRADIGTRGIVESTGTPKDLAAKLAETIQAERENSLYADELDRRSLFREAQLERLGGQFALAGATLNRSSEIAGATLRGAAGQMEYGSRMWDAEIARLSGKAQREAYNGQAWGTLLSGVGSSALSGATSYASIT